MRLWIFAGWAATAREQKAAEQKITLMRTPRVTALGRAACLASAGFLVSSSAFFIASVLLLIS